MTSTTFWDFLTPPPNFSAKYILFVCKFGFFLSPLLFCLDVIYGGPAEGKVIILVAPAPSPSGVSALKSWSFQCLTLDLWKRLTVVAVAIRVELTNEDELSWVDE